MQREPKKKIDSDAVLEALKKLWAEPAHAWLYEVRNQTGYGNVQRYADALVVSLWPSRGIFCHGIEVKVSRSDWLKERDMPEKSAEIQRFCKHWWLATAPGIVQPAELPATWGLIEVNGKHKVIKEAPELIPEQPTWEFVASVLRNSSQTIQAAEQRARAKALVDVEKERNEYLASISQIRHAENVVKNHEELLKEIREFEGKIGCKLRYYNPSYTIKHMRAAQKMSEISPQHLSDSIARAITGLTNLRDEISGVTQIAEQLEVDDATE